MNVNGVSLSNSGLELIGDSSVGVAGLKRINPNVDNDTDLGTSTEKFKTLYYHTLDPAVPLASYLPLAGGTMTIVNLPM